MKSATLFALLLCIASVHALEAIAAKPTSTWQTNVIFKPLDPKVTDPATFWMPLRNPVPEDYVSSPRYPIVPTPGPIPMDILYEGGFPNGTVPKVPAKPTNVWAKNLWGFEFDDLTNWGGVYPYPYIVSPKTGNINLMYPGAPVNGSQNRAMGEGFFTPEDPSEKPLIYNASYPYMVMAASFDLGILIRNSVRTRLGELSELSATVEYLDANNQSVCKLYIVRGSPTVNLYCDNAILAFGSNIIGVPPIIGVNDLPPGQTVTASKFKLQTAQGPAHMQAEMWYAYFDNDVSLIVPNPPNQPINVTAPYTGSLQIGCGELDDQMAYLLDAAAGKYATGGQVLYDIDTANNKTNIRFAFTTAGKGSNDLIMLAIPHQQFLLESNKSVQMNNTAYWCVKGNLSAVRGDEWVLTYNLTSSGFGDEKKVNATLAPIVLEQAILDFKLVIDGCPGDNTTYGYPGYQNMELYAYVRDLAQWTDVAIVLENLGRRDLAVNLTKHILTCLSYVLMRPTEEPHPCPPPINNTAVCVRDQQNVYYDTEWGGLITGWYDRFAKGYCQCDKGCDTCCIGYNYCDNPTGWNGFSNYGNSFYNDHHFQYGYILKTIGWMIYYQEQKGAELGINATYLQNISTQALAFARDVANPDPKGDMYFPFARHKSAYDGHSNAEGYSYSGRILTWQNQQSGGESINAYYGVYLLGLALKDENVMNWGRIQLASEMQSLATYQHLSNRTEKLAQLPTPDINKWGKCLSILIGNGGSGATYYGPNVVFECGITILPITPITQEWVNSDWAQEAYEWMTWHVKRSGNCVYPNPLNMTKNPCPGDQDPSTFWGNAWGCCPTNDGFPMNQWRAFPDWFPYLYLHLGMKDPAAAWEKLEYKSPYNSTDNLPFPYLNEQNQVVGYQPDMSRTQALFFLATLNNNV